MALILSPSGFEILFTSLILLIVLFQPSKILFFLFELIMGFLLHVIWGIDLINTLLIVVSFYFLKSVVWNYASRN
jgi:hypothetical protein